MAATESACVGDFEPKFVDSQALDFCVKRLCRESELAVAPALLR
jgi:hypothetical protein